MRKGECEIEYFTDEEFIEKMELIESDLIRKQKKLLDEYDEVDKAYNYYMGGHKWHESRVMAEEKYIKLRDKYNKKCRELKDDLKFFNTICEKTNLEQLTKATQ